MKKFIILFFCIIPIFIFAAEPTKSQKQALFMMNYAQYVTYKLMTYNNIMALEEEYANLYNNMNFNTIDDYSSIETINALAEAIFEERKNHKNREKLEMSIKKKMNQALYNSLPSPSMVIFTNGLNPLALAVNTLGSLGYYFSTYQKYKNELSNEYDEKMFEFQIITENILNDLYQNLNTYTYELVKKYGISDYWRLNRNELEQMFKHIKDTDKSRSLQNLRNMSTGRYVKHFPMFWYHLAKIAAENGKDAEAIEYYTQFEHKNIEIFRYDRTAVDAYKGKIVILLKNQNLHKDEILNKLKFIENNKTSWKDFYFCALVYKLLNDNTNAKRLLERNITELSVELDNQFLNTDNLLKIYETNEDFSGKVYYSEIELNRFMLAEIGDKKVSLTSIEKHYKSGTQAFNEALYRFGLNSSTSLINVAKKDIEKVTVNAKPTFRNSYRIEVELPMQWMLSSNSELEAVFFKDGVDTPYKYPLVINEKASKKMKKKIIKIDECNLFYTTGNINLNWKKEKYTFAGIVLKHSIYPIQFNYDIELSKGAKNKKPYSINFNKKSYFLKEILCY